MDENEKFREWLEKLAELYGELGKLQTFGFSADDKCMLSEMDVYRITPGLNGITLVYSPQDITDRLKKIGVSYMINEEYASGTYEEVIFYVGGVKFSCLRDKKVNGTEAGKNEYTLRTDRADARTL